ncbi:hypothetical protein PHLGIDRAFT_99994 [Phlebiopsis gigantea 11061_1 CR5-6]|uniref:DUF302 domain-containing protein n=1 Tax=Phlebiopsis gigantea (strain 11061_1 CR5-6) TaxID=745531 RepID=A0A0C3SCZ6_PHLG1|nr:hypothetical protein PHLGIDRAFT_99994 [Phlebiopsis gigantea 11061_1 CR5-6]
MSVTTKIDTYVARRAVLTSPKPIEAVLAKLNQELNKEKEGQVAVTLATATSRAEIDSKFAELYEGERDFVYVVETPRSHSQWMNVYYDGEQSFEKAYTFVLGNPLLAKEMLKRDMSVGLYVPPKVLVQEIVGGGTKIVYELPTSWFAEQGSDMVREHAQVVETKLEQLFIRILTPLNVSKY